MKNLTLACILPLLLGCTTTHSDLAATVPPNSQSKTLLYQGTYAPSLSQRMREKALDALDSGNPNQAQNYRRLIGQTGTVSIRLQRRIDTYAFEDRVTAYEGSHSKDLQKDKLAFDEILLNSPQWQRAAINFTNIPLQTPQSFKSLKHSWQIAGPAHSGSYQGKSIDLTKVIYTEEIDDYTLSQSTFLLSDKLPGRLWSYEQNLIKGNKTQKTITLRFKSFQ